MYSDILKIFNMYFLIDKYVMFCFFETCSFNFGINTYLLILSVPVEIEDIQ